MADSPQVTVLMAVRNGMPYVVEAVESVLKQTWRDFEFVIVDDASTDGTRQAIRSFGDSRLRLFLNDSHLGQTHSLNQGLRLARGGYIARFDADDICYPERLKEQVDFLQEHPEVALVSSRMIGVNRSGRRVRMLGITLSDYGSFLGRLLRGDCPLLHSTVMFRRQTAEQTGGYDESFRIGQDYDLWARMAVYRFRAFVLAKPLVAYRFHGRQQTVADRNLHIGELHQAHKRLLGLFCPEGTSVTRLSMLLKADGRFWRECHSKEDVSASFLALERTLQRIRTQLQLTEEEFFRMKRLVVNRLGFGIRIAPQLARYPGWLFYPVVGLLSPLLIPHIRPVVGSISDWLRKGRLAVTCLRS